MSYIGRKHDKDIMKVLLCTTLYEIWKERNHRRLKISRRDAPSLAKEITTKAKQNLTRLLPELKDSIKIRVLCDYLVLDLNWNRKEPIKSRWDNP